MMGHFLKGNIGAAPLSCSMSKQKAHRPTFGGVWLHGTSPWVKIGSSPEGSEYLLHAQFASEWQVFSHASERI